MVNFALPEGATSTDLIGRLVDLKIVSALPHSLRGELV
jgi:hypothetical protein